MGVFDGIRSVLGLKAEADATSEADPEDLFGMSTAHLTMGADLGHDAVYEVGIGFSGVDSSQFRTLVKDARELVELGEDGSVARVSSDSSGYQWIVVRDKDYETLVTAAYTSADEFINQGYGSRLLAVVFPFKAPDGYAYWIYSFRRGAFYPFCPETTGSRDNSLEFKLLSVLDGELEVEDDEEYWYALWPDEPGAHPWE